MLQTCKSKTRAFNSLENTVHHTRVGVVVLADSPDVGTRLTPSPQRCVGRIGRLEWMSDCPI